MPDGSGAAREDLLLPSLPHGARAEREDLMLQGLPHGARELRAELHLSGMSHGARAAREDLLLQGLPYGRTAVRQASAVHGVQAGVLHEDDQLHEVSADASCVHGHAMRSGGRLQAGSGADMLPGAEGGAHCSWMVFSAVTRAEPSQK